MDSKIDIKGTFCTLNLETIRNNLVQCDKFFLHELMLCVVNSYFELYPEKTPKDLEELMRELNLNSGLIAMPISQVDDVQRIIEEKNGVVIQTRYLHLYPKPIALEDIKNEHLAKFYLNVSCRKRLDVINEMSAFSTYEENLVNLVETGSLTVLANQVPESDSITDFKQDDFKSNLQKGKIHLSIHSYSDIMKFAMTKYPHSKLMVLCSTDTETIYGLIFEGKLTCPVGYLEKNSFGQKALELIMLQQ